MSDSNALSAICAYAFGIDTANWDLSTSRFSETVDIDFSSLGGPEGSLSKGELRRLVEKRFGKKGLLNHTAIQQVFASPAAQDRFIAYFHARHYYKGAPVQAPKLDVFGWYDFALDGDSVTSLHLHVSGLEGNPSILA